MLIPLSENYTIRLMRDTSKQMVKVKVNDTCIMEGNEWDFHPGVNGLTEFGDFKGAASLTEKIYKYLLRNKVDFRKIKTLGERYRYTELSDYNKEEKEKRIKFLEDKISHYLDVIKANKKGTDCRLWIEWIQTWNNEIISLQSPPDNYKKWMTEPIEEIVLCTCNLVGIDRCQKHKSNAL